MRLSIKYSTVLLLSSVLFFAAGFLATPTMALDKVVVIPLMGSKGKPLKNIVTVAKANGDFTDPVAAMESITDASDSNPYLMVIGPGIYTITSTLQMKRYVDIVGSGRNITILHGAISSDNVDAPSAIISLADRTTLSDLAVSNEGEGQYTTGISGDDTFWTTLERINVYAGKGTIANHGINYFRSSNGGPSHGSASHIIRNTSVSAHGGQNAVAIFLSSTDATKIENVTAFASQGSITTYAVLISSSRGIRMSNVSAKANPAQGVSACIQVGSIMSLQFRSNVTMSRITAISDTAQYGVYIRTGYGYIRDSWLKGSTAGIIFGDSDYRIINTQIDNGVQHDQPGTQCRDTFDKDLADVDC